MRDSLQKSNKTYQRNFRGWDDGLESLWVRCKAIVELKTGETKVNTEVQQILMEQFIAINKDSVTI